MQVAFAVPPRRGLHHPTQPVAHPTRLPALRPPPSFHPSNQVLACPPDTELVFYGPQALLVEASVEPADFSSGLASSSMDCGDPLSSSDSDSEAAPDAAAAAAAAEEPQGFGALSVMRRGGLRPAKELRIKCSGEGGRHALADVAVSGEHGARCFRECTGLCSRGVLLC